MSRCLASLAIGLLLLSPPAIVAGADGPSACSEEVLKAHGLRRSGTTYVVPAEAEVQKKIGEARTLYQRLNFAWMQQRTLEQGTSNNKQMIQQMTQQRIFLNQQL